VVGCGIIIGVIIRRRLSLVNVWIGLSRERRRV
jgi:hypothetical protein